MAGLSQTNSSDFLTFLSQAYGSGNVLFDLTVAGGALFLLILLVAGLQLSGLTRTTSQKEVDCMIEVSELLNEIHLQIHELRNSVVQEFEKYRGDLGYIRQELKDMRVIHRMPTDESTWINPAEESLHEIFDLARTRQNIS